MSDPGPFPARPAKISLYLLRFHLKVNQALIAQLVDRSALMRGVPGSNPARNIDLKFLEMFDK